MIVAHQLITFSKRRFNIHGLTIATDPDCDRSARWELADQAAQLLHTLNLLIIDGQNDIMFFQSSFASGSILVNHRDFNAAFLFQMQRADSVRSNVTSVHAQV